MTRQSDVSYLRFRGVTKCPTQACTIPGDNAGKENIDKPWNARGQASRSTSRSRYHCGEGGECLQISASL